MSPLTCASSCAPRAPAAGQTSTVAAGSNDTPPRPLAATPPALGTDGFFLQRQREQVVVLLQQRSHWLALGLGEVVDPLPAVYLLVPDLLAVVAHPVLVLGHVEDEALEAILVAHFDCHKVSS